MRYLRRGCSASRRSGGGGSGRPRVRLGSLTGVSREEVGGSGAPSRLEERLRRFRAEPVKALPGHDERRSGWLLRGAVAGGRRWGPDDAAACVSFYIACEGDGDGDIAIGELRPGIGRDEVLDCPSVILRAGGSAEQ